MSIHNELMDVRVLRDARPGASVVTEDGQKLGEVGEVAGRYIKVDVRFGRDYWLSADYVTEEAPDHLTFGFAKKDLGAYRVDKPVMAADPLVDQQDAVLSQQAQVEQRERMERELAEQAARGRRRTG
jgi:hypothetical protein